MLILQVSPNNAFSQYACITSHYTDPLTPLLQVLLSLTTDIIKDLYQNLGGKMGELPDLKKRTVAEAIVRRWGERICVMGSDSYMS